MFGLHNYVLKIPLSLLYWTSFTFIGAKLSPYFRLAYYLKKKTGNYIDTVLRPFMIFIRFYFVCFRLKRLEDIRCQQVSKETSDKTSEKSCYPAVQTLFCTWFDHMHRCMGMTPWHNSMRRQTLATLQSHLA